MQVDSTHQSSALRRTALRGDHQQTFVNDHGSAFKAMYRKAFHETAGMLPGNVVAKGLVVP